KLIPFKPRQATVEEIKLAHSAEHISRVDNMAKLGGGWLDADTVMSPRSYEVALYAAGGVLVAVDEVLKREVNSAFALVRPPGHHATYWQAMGFCLFNNIVIAAKYALTRHNLDRILIVDYDVHHGNGTQDAFFTVKIINVPLPPGCGDDEFERVFHEVLAPAARRFEPELILVSAGYDAHWKDALASMRLTTTGFGRLTRILKRLADELCQGKIVFTLEGGYDLQALATSVRATLDVLLGNDNIPDPIGPPPGDIRPPDISGIIKTIRQAHGLVK
ncbi:MAG: putative deacetylase, partial [Dehalococcoidia bacterium]|nr:putative deacetylase [Dehalococcoidia bacterium]